MNKQEEKFLEMYILQLWQEMRHLENLRERATGLLLAISIVIFGFIVQQEIRSKAEFLAWFLVGIAIFGVIMNLKIFQMHQMCQSRLDKWYEYYSESFESSSKLLDLKEEADIVNKKAFPTFSKVPYHYILTGLNVFIMLIGLILLVLIRQ